MIEERFESYVYQIMQYVKYQENKPYIESILEEMRYTLFREDRNYIKQLEQENKQLKEQLEYLRSNEYLNQVKWERNFNEELVKDLQQRIDKAYNSLGILLQILEEQPSDKDIKWILERLKPIYEILGDKENES